ncbi:MAG: NblA-related protein [Leptolyngbyaceae cyanobacterium SM2_5_2]|nr:NblA-related protein [Leptolyngbyaceae cyanobacterium SM2_5_2]
MDTNQPLSLEQQFELRLFADQVRNLSLEESQELLIQLRESMLVQANTFREIIKDSWGIGQDLATVLEY